MEESATETMESETASWTDSIAASSKSVFTTVEDSVNAAGRATWQFFHDVPGHGTVLGFGVGLGAAMVIGVGELATACFAAYVSYRIFGYGESLSEAIENAIRFEAGKMQKEEIDKPLPE